MVHQPHFGKMRRLGSGPKKAAWEVSDLSLANSTNDGKCKVH